MSDATLLYYGLPEPLPKPVALRAGPLTMSFDPANGFIRHIRLGDHEIVRAIYGAVRDHNWATIPTQIVNLSQHAEKGSFRVTFDAICREGVVDYLWRGTITGDDTGQVVYEFEGESKSQFLRNRIGLCTLHPIPECAGKPCVLDHVDGSREEGAFPRHISPAQPFFDIRAITFPIANTGAQAQILFEGETFEMEDQRNWGDASFKTYSTPQRLPKPAQVQRGDKVQHAVTVSAKGLTRPILPVVQGRPPQLSIATTAGLTLPLLGACIPRAPHSLSPEQSQLLRVLKLNHVRADLDLAGDFSAALQRAQEQANSLGCGLHLALALSPDPADELARLRKELDRLNARVLLWLIFARGEPLPDAGRVRAAQSSLQSYAPGAFFAAGTQEWFVDLNTSRPNRDFQALLAFAASPQIHQRDNVTMVENLAGLMYQAESARELSAKPIVFSPITLRATPRSVPPGMDHVDPRQPTLLGAGWTLGAIARLTEPGNVHSATFYETVGATGLMEEGRVFPVYHLLADIGEFAATKVFQTHSTHPLLADGLTLVNPQGRRRILVANFTDEPLETKIKTGQTKAHIRYLDETNCQAAMANPEEFRRDPGIPAESVAGKIELRLLPFGLARVDLA